MMPRVSFLCDCSKEIKDALPVSPKEMPFVLKPITHKCKFTHLKEFQTHYR